MPALHLDELRLPRRRSRLLERAWREWCFLRVLARHFGIRFAMLMALLVGGTWLFQVCEPNEHPSAIESLHQTFGLIFGDAPDTFPSSPVLQALFFVLPLLGITVIIEAIVDFALTLRDRRRFERSWCIAMTRELNDHIILIGFGKLGFRTFTLLRKLGESVVVIERNENNQFLEEVRRDGSPLLIGDARREVLLRDANIEKARSVILATNDDLANLEIALDARRIVPKIRVVLRMFDQNMADKIRHGFNIHIAVSQSALSAPTFAMSAVEPSIVGSFVVGNQLVVMQRRTAHEGGPLCGKTIGELLLERNFGVVEHRPKDGSPRLFPPPPTRIRDGDELLLQGPYEAIRNLREG